MLATRVMPCLLLRAGSLVKTVKFKNPAYIGDAINTVRIYNEKEVDELIFLDITATPDRNPPPFGVIAEIAGECFMPFTYGGGLRSVEDAEKLFDLGVEKVAVNSYAMKNPAFVTELADSFGSQSVVVSIDVKKSWTGKYGVYTHGGRRATGRDPVDAVREMEERGAGEILLTAVDRDGTMAGYDLNLIRSVSSAVDIPVIACGGAGEVEHFREAVQNGASAVAAGSMVVYQGRNRAVLINFPERSELEEIFDEGTH